jgi:hypothetical protein
MAFYLLLERLEMADTISIEFGFSAESYVPESHPWYELDFYFWVKANVSRRREATYYEPAEGGEVEILSAVLTGRAGRTDDEIKAVESWFMELVDHNQGMKDALYEELGIEDRERRACRGYDG